jgi:dethiobiotin synthase
MKGIFIIGTDTGVGKTTVSAGLLKLLHGAKKAAFWKPVQTGTIMGDDTKEVAELTQLPASCYLEPAYRFPEPLAPQIAAKRWGKEIDVKLLVEFANKKIAEGIFPIIEGAGGALVPYNEKELQIDFMKKLGLPVLLIGQDRVGQINQTLLSLRAIRESGLDLLGVVITKMRGTFGNAESIAHFGKVEILCQVSDTPNKAEIVAEVGTNTKLRALFNIPALP